MTIILELAAPGSHQWKVLGHRISPSVNVENICWCIYHYFLPELFVHHLAWKSSVCIPLSQMREQGPSAGHPLSPSGFWEHSQVPLGFGVLLCPWTSTTPEQGTSQVTCSSGCGCTCLWQKHTTKEESFSQTAPASQTSGSCSNRSYPRPISCASCALPAHFLEEKAVAGKQGNLDFVPALACQCFPSCSGVCPPWEGPSPACTEIKATVLGGISDCCYNKSIFSGHEPVCKVQFLIKSRFFQKAKKLVRPNPVFSNWIKPALKKKKKGKIVQTSDCRLVLIIENSQHAMFIFPFSGKGLASCIHTTIFPTSLA